MKIARCSGKRDKKNYNFQIYVKTLSSRFKNTDEPISNARSSISKCEQWCGVDKVSFGFGAEPIKKKSAISDDLNKIELMGYKPLKTIETTYNIDNTNNGKNYFANKVLVSDESETE